MALKPTPDEVDAAVVMAELIDRTLLGFMTIFGGRSVAWGLGIVLGAVARACPAMRADIAYAEQCARDAADNKRGTLKAALTNEGRREDESIN
jgi:hypothetical protein